MQEWAGQAGADAPPGEGDAAKAFEGRFREAVTDDLDMPHALVVMDEAIASYREAVRLEPDDPAVLDNLAAAYAAAGRRQAAIATARRAADRARAAGEPTLAAAIERRAQLYGHLVLRHTPDPGG